MDAKRIVAVFAVLILALCASEIVSAPDDDAAGRLIIKEDTTIPYGAELDASENGIWIMKGATLTIDDGAAFYLNGASMLVEGTLIIENMNDSIVLGDGDKIEADTIVNEGSYRIYDNIVHRLANSTPGEKISLYTLNPNRDVALVNESSSIPAGVELSVVGKSLKVKSGCALTVNGTLTVDNQTHLLATDGWSSSTTDVVSGETVNRSVLAVGNTGSIVFESKPSHTSLFTEYKTAGAYHYEDINGVKGRTIMTSVPTAFASVLDYYGDAAYVAGDLTISNLTLIGNKDVCPTVVIIGGSKVELKAVSLNLASLKVEQGAQVSGGISTGSGSVEFSKLAMSGADSGFSETYTDGSLNLTLIGSFTSSETFTVKGTVSVSSFTFTSVQKDNGKNDAKFAVMPNSEFIVGNTAVITCSETSVYGTLTITNSGTLGIIGDLSVLGTLDMQKRGQLASSLSVSGSIYVGGSQDSYAPFVVGSTALITGSGSFSETNLVKLAVFRGSTVDADVIVNWMESRAVSTEFFIDGILWCTTYAKNATSVLIATSVYEGKELKSVTYYGVPTLKDCKFDYWKVFHEDSGKYRPIKPPASNPNAYVGQKDYEKVYLFTPKDIYNVTVVADLGIDNIYIDGKIMSKSVQSNVYTQAVKAGTHTISYKLANGYSGEAVITTVDGEALEGAGLEFTVNDDSYNYFKDSMVITFSGIKKSGLDTDPDTHPDIVQDEDDIRLTFMDYILIAVVAIIATMTAILTLMLNRR